MLLDLSGGRPPGLLLLDLAPEHSPPRRRWRLQSQHHCHWRCPERLFVVASSVGTADSGGLVLFGAVSDQRGLLSQLRRPFGWLLVQRCSSRCVMLPCLHFRWLQTHLLEYLDSSDLIGRHRGAPSCCHQWAGYRRRRN